MKRIDWPAVGNTLLYTAMVVFLLPFVIGGIIIAWRFLFFVLSAS